MWGDSLLSLLVELLAELQWGDAMLLPVLVVGYQDLVIKLFGSCSDFKMETVSVQRKGHQECDGRLRSSTRLRPQAMWRGFPSAPQPVMPCSTPLPILSASLVSPSTSLHICTPWIMQGRMGRMLGIWVFIQSNGKQVSELVRTVFLKVPAGC